MAGDKDLSLKVKTAALFWSSGYYFRIGVRLSDYEPGGAKPLELTDLDVYALKVHPDFLTDAVVADCKSSVKNTSPITRAFWLRGVMDYFAARYGYVVTAKAPEEVHKVAARRLSVTMLTQEEVDRLLGQAADPDVMNSEMFRESSWEYFEKGLSELHRDLEGLVRFRHYDFWLNDMGQNPSATISAIRRCKGILNEEPKSRFHRALVLDLLALFTVSLLHLASVVYSTSPSDVEAGVRAVLHGGALSLKRKQAIVGTVRRLVQELTNDEALVASLEKRLDLDPPYFKDILEVCLRIVNRPIEAATILRYYQALLFERVLFPSSKAKALSHVGISPVGVKLAKDIALLVEKAAGLDPNLMGPVMGFENYSVTTTRAGRRLDGQLQLDIEMPTPKLKPRANSLERTSNDTEKTDAQEQEYRQLEANGMNRQVQGAVPTGEPSESLEGASVPGEERTPGETEADVKPDQPDPLGTGDPK